MTFDRIAVVGAGAWGTALANTLTRAGRSVTLIGRGAESMARLRETRQNLRLPDVRLDERIVVTAEIGEGRRPTRSCWWCPRRRCVLPQPPSTACCAPVRR